jgi:hypothetical protein
VSENRVSLRKASLEVLALVTVAWIINIFIEPDPPGVNVTPFGLKWFVYTYLMAAIVSVFAPFLVALLVGLVIFSIVLRKANYGQVYRSALILAAIWTVLGNYGLWYGKCREAHSIDQCQMVPWISN